MGISLKGFTKPGVGGAGGIAGVRLLPPAAIIAQNIPPVVLGQKGYLPNPNNNAGASDFSAIRSPVISLGTVDNGTKVRIRTDYSIVGAKNYFTIGARDGVGPFNIILSSDQGIILDAAPQFTGWTRSAGTWITNDGLNRIYTANTAGYVEYTFSNQYTNTTIQFSIENGNANSRYGAIVDLL